jgi:hypothetical protein
MIKIRYCDPSMFSPGLHAAAERHGRSTVIYLLSGLTVPQRRAALRRLRLSARMGYCPRLPAAQFGLALLADRIRTTTGQAGAVFRTHPAGAMVPVMMAAGAAIAFLVLSSVSMPALPGHPPALGDPAPTASASAAPAAGPSPSPGPGSRPAGASTGQVTADRSGRGGSPSPPSSSAPGTGGQASPGGTGAPGRGAPSPSGTASAPPASGPGGPSPPPRPGQPSPSPSTTGATPSAVPITDSQGGICLDVGRLEICLGG